jgi:hypothetical protein
VWLQARVAADGRVSLRHRGAAADAAWTEDGSWTLLGVGRVEAARALEGLRRAMSAAIDGKDLRDADGSSKARLLLDVEATAPWKLVQWVGVTAASPYTKIWRLTFLDGAGEGFDLDLPKDEGMEGAAPPAGTSLTLSFRRATDGSGAPPTTHVRVEAGPRKAEAEEADVEPEDEVDEAEAEAAGGADFALAADDAGDAARAAPWREIAAHLAAKAKGAPGLVGEIAAPPPTGGDTPYRDVLAGMRALKAAGAPTILLEGAVTPIAR